MSKYLLALTLLISLPFGAPPTSYKYLTGAVPVAMVKGEWKLTGTAGLSSSTEKNASELLS